MRINNKQKEITNDDDHLDEYNQQHKHVHFEAKQQLIHRPPKKQPKNKLRPAKAITLMPASSPQLTQDSTIETSVAIMHKVRKVLMKQKK